ncbi:MAG: alpha/beta hydrolase [Gammaproteobacteria bacterium]|nr:alpha/beta hydrolase [Gammaproteobacteria bacterium]
MLWWSLRASWWIEMLAVRKISVTCFAILWLSACQQEGSVEITFRENFLANRATALETFSPCERDATTQMASLVADSLCTRFSVPENYADPESRQIELKVMIIPSLSDLPEPDPLFLLAGGPGQAGTDLVRVAQVFGRTRTERDIVMVDQRGTGELSPFDCQMDEEEAKVLEVQDPDTEEILAIQMTLFRECLADTEADPEFYTTDIAMRDLDAVRDFLGYSKVNLWGASYGSRAALAYLQAYPENTRTVIIDAIAPISLILPLYTERDATASMEKLLADCGVNESCNTAYPDLESSFRQLLDRLETPEPVTLVDSRDFSSIETSLSRDEFLGFIRQVLYSREAQRLVPFIINQALNGNFQPVIALSGQYAEADINQGMFLSVICSEDYSLITEELSSAESGNDYLLDTEMFNRFILEACQFWPKREVPASYFEPVTEDKPVLVFSGAYDPITPPVWGELVHENLPDSLHLVLDGFGHGTLFTQCTAGIMFDFIEAGTLDSLETECTSQFGRRPFFVTPGGSSLIND